MVKCQEFICKSSLFENKITVDRMMSWNLALHEVPLLLELGIGVKSSVLGCEKFDEVLVILPLIGGVNAVLLRSHANPCGKFLDQFEWYHFKHLLF